MRSFFFSPFKNTPHPAAIISTGQIYFQPLQPQPPLPLPLPPLPGPIVVSIHADTQYPAAASTALTELPFSCNNRPDHHSINAPVQSLHVCLSANECSTPATCLICYSKPSVWKGPYNTTLHSCRTQLHHMPSTNPILSIRHPILGSLSKQEKKKKNRFRLSCSRTASPFSSFWLQYSVIDGDILFVTAGLRYKKWSRGFNYHCEFIYDAGKLNSLCFN